MVTKQIPTRTTQLIVHSASGLYITPLGRQNADVEMRLWRLGPASAGDKTVQWHFILIPGQQLDGVVQIKNAAYDRCLTLSHARPNTTVTYTTTDPADQAQWWRLINLDTGQADFVIASMLDPSLVISPRESYHAPEITLEVEESGPWTDQFWRWREPWSS
ncbi:RICIN domain-containing protein [Actinomadura rubrisoli]|uniref:Ricin B lectin domain-containing protein n=1 Tax=Actinomadura rubrisoli TaxID=2530368 RepID=A0A4V2YVH9_9ACTN|nr:RICIN domain-containing protein [Actinomadura rubrisoli]TDD81527.1 hypothetical protein E1298_24055 [Actinomadura rubrisoli]